MRLRTLVASCINKNRYSLTLLAERLSSGGGMVPVSDPRSKTIYSYEIVEENGNLSLERHIINEYLISSGNPLLLILVVMGIVFSIIIEYPVFSLIVKKFTLKNVKYISLINIISYPVAIIISIMASIISQIYHMVLFEVFVILIEVALIRRIFKFSYKKSFLISLAINIVSMVVGFILTLLIVI